MIRGRPRQFDRDDTLTAVMETFWDHGYENTCLAELEERTGVGRQSLYNTFGDKRALFLAALERYLVEYQGAVIAQLEGGGSPLANVEAVLDQWVEHATGGDRRGCLVANSCAEFGSRDADVSALLRSASERVERAFRGAFERARDAGELAADRDPRALASLFTALGPGLAVVGKLRDASFSVDAIEAARELLR